MGNSVRNFAAAVAAGLGLMAACGAAQAANLIQNGDLEAPDVSGYAIIAAGSSFTGWDVVGAGNVAPIDTGFSAFGSTLNAQAGAQWIDMSGATTTGAGIQQSVATDLGQRYSLSFWVGNANTNGPGSSSTINVLVNGVQIFSATNSAITAGQQVWQEFQTSFSGTGAPTTIAFFNGDAAGDDNNGLDSITLTATAAPEPAAWAMMIMGFSGMGVFLRRRRAIVAA
jgi:hypothetical protein